MSLDTDILAAIEPFRDAGFALHYLHPRQKRPIGNGWSSAPVASLADLRRTHAAGNNLGVRLGEPSVLTSGGYLHVLDLDIRIPDLADEAWEAFEKLGLGPREAFPEVQSGSDGESRHLYLVTDRPFDSRKLAVSDGKHRGTDGKWHHDWEIEFFGTGKQVAMPPSIHPESGKPYRWLREFDFAELEFGGGPVVSSSLIESLGAAETAEYEFETREPLEFKDGQLERYLADVPVSDLHYDDWIKLGQALHHQFGGSAEGFDLWLEHTKRSSKYTGPAQEREMRRIKWRSFGKWRKQPVTMGTVIAWAQEVRLARLADEYDEVDEFDDAESDEFDDLLDAASPVASDDNDWDGGPDEPETKISWTSLLALNEEGKTVANLHNIELILKNDVRLQGLAQLNEFTHETVQRTTPGTKAKKRKNSAKETRQLSGRVWEVKDTLNGELWSDDRDFAIRSIIEAPDTQGGYGIKVTDRDLKAAIVLAANSNAFHPVREYLDGLQWDGVERVDRLWIDYVGASDDCYHRDVARMAMVAAVTRIFEPGHKFDFATILEGLQGKRKSTLIEILGRKWFAELDGDFHDQKQMVELMQNAWIMEIPELTGFSRADVRSIKAFISRKKDRARLAYARRAGEFPRQCIFIGSTNDREYLKDDTGGRRFWPVKCNFTAAQEIDTDTLEENVDQMWAEAVALYHEMRKAKPVGTLPLYLSNPESRAIAARLQESRRLESPDDVLAGQIAEWLSRPVVSGDMDDDFDNGKPVYREDVCTAMVWVECLNKDLSSFNTVEQGKVNRALSKVEGWEPDGSMRFPRYGKQRVFRKFGQPLD